MFARDRIDPAISAGRSGGGRLCRSICRGATGRGGLALLFAVLLAVGVAALLMPSGNAQASPSGVRLGAVSAHEDAGSAYGSGLDVSLDVVNPGEAFSGWIEIEGDRRRVLRGVEVPPGGGTLRFSSYRVDYRGFLAPAVA